MSELQESTGNTTEEYTQTKIVKHLNANTALDARKTNRYTNEFSQPPYYTPCLSFPLIHTDSHTEA